MRDGSEPAISSVSPAGAPPLLGGSTAGRLRARLLLVADRAAAHAHAHEPAAAALADLHAQVLPPALVAERVPARHARRHLRRHVAQARGARQLRGAACRRARGRARRRADGRARCAAPQAQTGGGAAQRGAARRSHAAPTRMRSLAAGRAPRRRGRLEAAARPGRGGSCSRARAWRQGRLVRAGRDARRTVHRVHAALRHGACIMTA